jgi:hypothetical protein
MHFLLRLGIGCVILCSIVCLFFTVSEEPADDGAVRSGAGVHLGGGPGGQVAGHSEVDSGVERADQRSGDGTDPGPDERLRRLALGTWEDDYQGKRTMTLRNDGTATMVVELSGAKATLFAARLRFDMVWSIKDGHMRKQTLGGEPPRKVQLILKMMGDVVEEKILELGEDTLVLLDEDGKTRYRWRRVPESGPPVTG